MSKKGCTFAFMDTNYASSLIGQFVSWIPVKDSPTKEGPYLVAVTWYGAGEKYVVEYLYWYDGHWETMEGGGVDNKQSQITHWMEVPKNPHL